MSNEFFFQYVFTVRIFLAEPKEQRKSDRMCKGKRYERFMVEGKLLGNKRDTKLTQHHRICSRIDSKIDQELTMTKAVGGDAPGFNLENTIKRLAERTNVKIDYNDVTSKVCCFSTYSTVRQHC